MHSNRLIHLRECRYLSHAAVSIESTQYIPNPPPSIHRRHPFLSFSRTVPRGDSIPAQCACLKPSRVYNIRQCRPMQSPTRSTRTIFQSGACTNDSVPRFVTFLQILCSRDKNRVRNPAAVAVMPWVGMGLPTWRPRWTRAKRSEIESFMCSFACLERVVLLCGWFDRGYEFLNVITVTLSAVTSECKRRSPSRPAKQFMN